ncbi:MAG: cryptochrome/photolyase family protein, partial [Limnohabitans sp.]
MSPATRHLVLVLGDQLNADSSAFHGFDPAQDRVWMAEVDEESTHVPSSKQRTTLFLSAMRHFAQHLRDKDWPVVYRLLDDADNKGSLASELDQAIREYQPRGLVMTAPGEWRVWQQLRQTAEQHGLPLEVRDDDHFLCTVRDFKAYVQGKKQIRLEYFYRELRRKHNILMEGKQPIGDQWNFDADNRGSFGKSGPGKLPAPSRFEPDDITREVMGCVNIRFAHHPGSVSPFGWPVTRTQALQALADF